jgi:hypothetical protein
MKGQGKAGKKEGEKQERNVQKYSFVLFCTPEASLY